MKIKKTENLQSNCDILQKQRSQQTNLRKEVGVDNVGSSFISPE